MFGAKIGGEGLEVLFKFPNSVVLPNKHVSEAQIECYVGKDTYSLEPNHSIKIVSFSEALMVSQVFELLKKEGYRIVDSHTGQSFIELYGKKLSHGRIICALDDNKKQTACFVVPGFQKGFKLEVLSSKELLYFHYQTGHERILIFS